MHESRAWVGDVATTSTEVWSTTAGACFIQFIDRSARSVSLLQGPTKHDETNEGIRHGRTSQALFFRFYLRAKRQSTRAKPLFFWFIWADSNCPRKSRQAVSSKKNNALEVNLWLRPVLFPGSTSGAYLQEEVRARESQIPASSHIWRTETELSTGASPSRSAFSNGCQRQFKAKWLAEYQWLTYSASEDGGFYHALCFTEVVVKMLGSWSRSPWPTGRELEQPWMSTAVSKTLRESVSDAAQLQKEDPSVAQLVAAQNDDVISANKGKLRSILDCVVNWGWRWWDGTDLCLKLCWRKELHDVKEMIRHGWTDGAYLKRLTKIGQNLLILDTICKKIFRGQAPHPYLPNIEPSSLPLGLRPWQHWIKMSAGHCWCLGGRSIAFVLFTLMQRPLSASQVPRRAAASDRQAARVVVVFPLQYINMSSAKSTDLMVFVAERTSGTFLVYSKNRSSPRTLPCGTPRLHEVGALTVFPHRTCCCLSA